MATLTLIQKDKQETMSVPKALLIDVNPILLIQALFVYQNNTHRPTAQTKTRGLVSGTGKKPWKQKGTGQARHGSRRSPIWIGGGITFGPTANQNYSRKLTQTERANALKMLLRLAIDGQRLVVIDTLPIFNKTKEVTTWFSKLPIEAGAVTIIATKSEKKSRGLANLPLVSFQTLDGLRFDLLNKSDWIVIEKEALEAIK
jgi:large subunit ribosomal protein L4